MGEILNYLIGGGALFYMTFRLKEKASKDPRFEIAGMGIKTLINLAYIGICCYALLVLMALSKT